MVDILIPSKGQIDIAVEGIYVILIIDGQRVAEIPWRAAQRLHVAIKKQANKAQLNEEKVADQTAFDAGLLLRKGIPIGITDNRYIKKQAEIEAAHNPILRKTRKGAGDIQSKGAVGTPDVLKHRPPPTKVEL